MQELNARVETLSTSADAARERAAAAEARAQDATEERKRGEEREARLGEDLAGLRKLLETHFNVE